MMLQVSQADVSRLERRIRSINGMAQIQRSQRADVSLDYVLGIGGFDLERVDNEVSFTHATAFKIGRTPPVYCDTYCVVLVTLSCVI